MTVYQMSKRELDRLEVLRQIEQKQLSVVDAARLLGLSRSQTHRLLSRFRDEGISAVVSRKRGKPSNRRYSDDFRTYVLNMVRSCYHDFGPTLVVEALAERHEISISKETARHWMIEAGLWESRTERK